ncbi:16S rRNA (guanine(966)-N(2))-methyltransferase RsmD [Nocardia sp. NPDC004068]|uniref:16S rRNA (guanine(966)-N(2))-methyltransferase RsmD n=1 Tax=Nocardia sp. NPDC004068 TaxID=3364303 RepID=UPI0036B22C58
MTRIVSGIAGGRRLRVPPAGTRPTSDRVREALFNLIAARMDFDGLRVLDLYAGSGALGLEALSRGAAHALLVESDRKAAATIRANITALALPGAELRPATVTSTLATPPETPYVLIFSDPPYALETPLITADLQALTTNNWLQADALIIIERSTRTPPTPWPTPYTPLKPRTYGETRLDLATYPH